MKTLREKQRSHNRIDNVSIGFAMSCQWVFTESMERRQQQSFLTLIPIPQHVTDALNMRWERAF
jgi:hypothetical protein